MTDQNQGQPNSGEGSTQPPAWYSDEQKSYVETKGWKAPADVITSVQNLEKLVGMDKAGRAIYKPKDDNDAEGIKAFRTALGVPEKPEDYKLPVPEGGDAAFAGTVAQWFHEAGIPAAAGQKIATAWNDHIAKLVADEEAAAKAEGEKQIAALRSEWGNQFDANAEHARRFLKASGLTDDQVVAIEGALGAAQMLKVFHQWGTKVGEASSVDGERKAGFGADKGTIQGKLDELRQRRLENKIGEREYISQVEQLNRQLAAAS